MPGKSVSVDKMRLIKQIQDAEEARRRELREMVVEASVGNGLVVARMSGYKTLDKLTIDPQLMVPDGAGYLEDLIRAAVNEAGRRVDERLRGEYASLIDRLPDLR